MKNLILTAAISTLIVGCNTMETAPVPEFVTAKMPVDDAKDLLIEAFARKGGFCEETRNTLKCDVPVSDTQDMLVRAFISGPYGGSTKRTAYFTFIDNKDKTTRVYVRTILTAVKASGAEINSSSKLTKGDMDALQQSFDRHSNKR